MTQTTVGVLVMSYGTPEDMDQVEAYYTHIRGGRPPSAEQLQELKDRYEAIGGVFPLRKNTNAQVQALEEKLQSSVTGVHFKCYQGLKHAAPFIEDGVRQMAADGIQEAVGLVLAPHYSRMSVGSYIQRARETAEELGLSMSFIESYHLHPSLIQALVERAKETLARFDRDVQEDVRFIFTAHSLPEKIVEMKDPYPQQLLETSQTIMEQSGLPNKWQFAWQSAGQTPMPWLGPDILDVLKQIHAEENVRHVIISPIGFVSDHLEVLYDIDIECQAVARQLGMHLERTRSLNTDPLYINTLADVVVRTWKGSNA